MYIQQNLVRDGTLVLSVDETLRHAAAEWMPSLPEAQAERHPEGPSIRVDRQTLTIPFATGKPSLALGNVNAWISDSDKIAWLENRACTIQGQIDLQSRVARVAINEGADVSPADVTSLLTISAALLLVRDGRTAVHAAAVAHPESRKGWLLVGDSHSGKSTTTANLIRAGWYYLSDDYVVLSRSDQGEIEVEGWPDDFHLDEGWYRGEPTGVRGTLSEAELPQGRRLPGATLDGILFPRVWPSEKTVATHVDPLFAIERLIRQSPWLIADKRGADKVYMLLRDAASLPAGALRLGLDTFADPEKLSSVVMQFAERAR